MPNSPDNFPKRDVNMFIRLMRGAHGSELGLIEMRTKDGERADILAVVDNGPNHEVRVVPLARILTEAEVENLTPIAAPLPPWTARARIVKGRCRNAGPSLN